MLPFEIRRYTAEHIAFYEAASVPRVSTNRCRLRPAIFPSVVLFGATGLGRLNRLTIEDARTGRWRHARKGLISRRPVSAERVGASLKNDPTHRAASFLSREQMLKGKVFTITSIARLWADVFPTTFAVKEFMFVFFKKSMRNKRAQESLF